MNDWFKEYWNNYTGRNRFYASDVYNPSTGELHLHTLLGLGSAILSIVNFTMYITRQEAFVAVMLGVLTIGMGIAGLIMSCRNLPYAFRIKSLYRVYATLSGVLLAVIGILGTIWLYIVIFVPQEVIVSIIKNMNFD